MGAITAIKLAVLLMIDSYQDSSMNPTMTLRTSADRSCWNAVTSSRKLSNNAGSWWMTSSWILIKASTLAWSSELAAAAFNNSTTWLKTKQANKKKTLQNWNYELLMKLYTLSCVVSFSCLMWAIFQEDSAAKKKSGKWMDFTAATNNSNNSKMLKTTGSKNYTNKLLKSRFYFS